MRQINQQETGSSPELESSMEKLLVFQESRSILLRSTRRARAMHRLCNLQPLSDYPRQLL